MIEGIVEKIAEEVLENITVMGIGTSTTTTMSPIIPQIVALKTLAQAANFLL